MSKNMNKKYNRLVDSSSPYLIQHADNPVDWYPWEDEAFTRAQKENKPIFLSIGYSTCHWCHVMAHESFEDEAVAELLNQHFISIKVDREQRPDLDAIYMAVTQRMAGRGGWPMSVVLTPDKKPFFAGTYFPKTSRWGKPGMMELLPALHHAWDSRRAEVLDTADQVTRVMRQSSTLPSGESLTHETLAQAEKELTDRYDSTNGGFGTAPKFPSPHQLTFLLRQHRHSGNQLLLRMVENTLMHMRQGGIFDQIGYGFHRYATDAQWLVPHFEKMLYDQALIAMAYLETWQITGNPLYAETVHHIFTYVLNNLSAPEGGFYTAEDADSDGVEGKFYVWSTGEVESILDPSDARVFMRAYNLSDSGNFLNEVTRKKQGLNIPHLTNSLKELSAELNLPEETFARQLEESRKKLIATRDKRIRPFKDDKILTDWNGLMIAALAQAGRVLDEPAYTTAAKRAADFILTQLRDENGFLIKTYRRGKSTGSAHLDDYAFLVWGLVELYASTFDPDDLEAAVSLNDQMLRRFEDPENGGLYLTANDGETLLFRHKNIQDGALPSGNAVAALNLLRLNNLTGNATYIEKAERIMKAFSPQVARMPSGHTFLMGALVHALYPNYQIVVVGSPDAADTRAMLAATQKPFLPEKTIIFKPDTGDTSRLTALAPFTAPMTSIDGQATAYVCKSFTCKLPTTRIDEMMNNLTPGK